MLTWREDWCIQLDEDRRGERRNSEKRPYTSTHHTHCLVHWTRQVLQSRMDKLWENVSQDCNLCINSCWLLDLKHHEVLNTLLGNWGTLRKISTGGVESGLLRTITELWYLQPAPGRVFCAESWQCWRPLLGMQEFKKRLVGSRCGGVLLRGAQNCHTTAIILSLDFFSGSVIKMQRRIAGGSFHPRLYHLNNLLQCIAAPGFLSSIYKNIQRFATWHSMRGMGMHIGLQDSERRSMYWDYHVTSMNSNSLTSSGRCWNAAFVATSFPGW